MSSERPLLLAVDDDEAILALVRRLAEREGYDIVTRANGREAIEFLKQRSPELVLVDLQMPEVGGLDVVRAVREADPHCQVALMTGHASIDTAVEAIKLGAMDYLTKPFDLAQLRRLLTAVRDEIDKRRSLLAAESELAKRLELCGMIGRGLDACGRAAARHEAVGRQRAGAAQRHRARLHPRHRAVDYRTGLIRNGRQVVADCVAGGIIGCRSSSARCRHSRRRSCWGPSNTDAAC